MEDVAYRNAQAARDRLAAEINRLQQHIDELRHELKRTDEFIETWHKFAGILDNVSGTQVSTQASVAQPPKPAGNRNPPKEEVTEAALRLIRDWGSPLTRTQLYDALQTEGIELHGKDPEMVLSTMLWRMRSRIVRLKSGYWPADEPYAKAGYIPLTDAIRSQYADLKRKVDNADVRYYTANAPDMDDSTYDVLRHKLREFEDRHPELAAMDVEDAS